MNADSGKQLRNPQPSNVEADKRPSVHAQSGYASDSPYELIHLDACSVADRMAVTTGANEYELIVLGASAGEVLVRGGHYFPEFRHARLAGSTFGGSAINLRSIEVGCCLELHVDGKTIVTSTIRSISHMGVQETARGAMSSYPDPELNSTTVL
jgi:hypothetical protein